MKRWASIPTALTLDLMIELPNDFPHEPPRGYNYEAIRHKSNVIAIWLVSTRRWVYNGGDESRTIWGFYNTKKRQYHSPINSIKVGDVVDVSKTRAYTAMPILKPMRPSILSFC